MVPETVTLPPGVSVWPVAMTKAVVPPFTDAETGKPLGRVVVMGDDADRVDETPLTTTMEPDAVAGIEYVVPETVTALPGARVWPGAIEKAVVPSFTSALIVFWLSPSARVGEGPEIVEVAPFTTKIEPDAVAGIE